MRAFVLVAALLLAGCERPFAGADCPQREGATADAASGMLVHVTTLNDANLNAVVCYRVGGGATHAAPVRASGSTPNLGRGDDLRAPPAATVEAWIAGAGDVGRATLPVANESWVALVTRPTGVEVVVFDQPPVFD